MVPKPKRGDERVGPVEVPLPLVDWRASILSLLLDSLSELDSDVLGREAIEHALGKLEELHKAPPEDPKQPPPQPPSPPGPPRATPRT